jgi:hypothetical protein
MRFFFSSCSVDRATYASSLSWLMSLILFFRGAEAFMLDRVADISFFNPFEGDAVEELVAGGVADISFAMSALSALTDLLLVASRERVASGDRAGTKRLPVITEISVMMASHTSWICDSKNVQ